METDIPPITSKAEYIKDRCVAYVAKLKEKCSYWICPCCGEEWPVSKFMKTIFIQGFECLPELLHEGKGETYDSTSMSVRSMFFSPKNAPLSLKFEIMSFRLYDPTTRGMTSSTSSVTTTPDKKKMNSLLNDF
jgi:hypothetical protein